MTRVLYAAIFIALLTGCKKEDVKPSQSEINAQLLAGNVGQSKSWTLTSWSQQIGTDSIQSLTLLPCFADNIYTFTNNSQQNYQCTEGATKCNAYDSDLVEAGTWAFTDDGKMVIILSNILTESSNSFFSVYGFAFPAEVTQLSEDTFSIQMTITQTTLGTTTVDIFNFTFTKI
jgi:hypothetical protein